MAWAVTGPKSKIDFWILTYHLRPLSKHLNVIGPTELELWPFNTLFNATCISCCFLFTGKPSTEIDLIHDINEPLQFQTTIDIHGNESTTPSQVLENSDGYVDIGAEEIPPLDHPLRTSLANNTDFAHLQDNAIEIHYHTIDADGMDKSDYTDLRKPPPISPKPRGVKSQLMNGPRAVKKIDGDKLSTEHRKPPPLAEKKKSY